MRLVGSILQGVYLFACLVHQNGMGLRRMCSPSASRYYLVPPLPQSDEVQLKYHRPSSGLHPHRVRRELSRSGAVWCRIRRHHCGDPGERHVAGVSSTTQTRSLAYFEQVPVFSLRLKDGWCSAVRRPRKVSQLSGCSSAYALTHGVQVI